MNFKKLAMIATGTTAGALVISNTIFRKTDPRTRALISFTSGLFIANFFSEDKLVSATGKGLMISGLIDGFNSIRGGAISENKYNGYIWVLMEDGQTLRKLKPYQTIGVLKKIDGIATPYNPGYVYKVPSACMVRVLSNGNIELSSWFSRSINNNLTEQAGWRDETFLDEYPSWQGLFEKSLEF